MELDALDVLVGKWEITGRTLDADKDNVSGEMSGERILNGKVLELRGVMRFSGGQMETIELIWPDGDGGFRAHVYSDDSGPVEYRWERDGVRLTHAGSGATYTGMISNDGLVIAGGWRPDGDSADETGNAYDATMRRIG